MGHWAVNYTGTKSFINTQFYSFGYLYWTLIDRFKLFFDTREGIFRLLSLGDIYIYLSFIVLSLNFPGILFSGTLIHVKKLAIRNVMSNGEHKFYTTLINYLILVWFSVNIKCSTFLLTLGYKSIEAESKSRLTNI